MKNVKYFNILFFTILTITTLAAQKSATKNSQKLDLHSSNVKVSFGEESKSERSEAKVKYIIKDGKGNIYVIRFAEGGMFLANKSYIGKYNPSLQQVFEKELVIEGTNGKDLGIVNALTINGQPYIFGDFYNTVKNRRYLFAMKIESNGKLGEPEKIADFDSNRDKGHFQIKLSKDSSKVLVVSMPPVDKKKEAIPVAFTVLDNNLKEIWKGESSFPTDKKWDIFSGTYYTTYLDNFMISNSGKVTTIVQVPREKESKTKGEAEVYYKVFVFQKDSKNPTSFKLDLNNKMIGSTQLLEISNSDEIRVVGTYSDNPRDKWSDDDMTINGTFYYSFNSQNGATGIHSITPFTKEIYEFMRVSEKDLQKKKGVYAVSLWDYYLTQNNNILLSIEQKYSYLKRASDKTYHRYYCSEVMFNIKYDKDGKVIYQNYIPKKLTAASTFGLYHILAPQGENHALIFNDNDKNMDRALKDAYDIKLAVPRNNKTVTRLVTVDETGKKTLSTLFTNKEAELITHTEIALQYAPNTIITMGINGKKSKLIKIEY